MTYRSTGLQALENLKCGAKESEAIEKLIHKASTKHSTISDKDIETVYTDILYQIIGDIIDGVDYTVIKTRLRSDKIEWQHPMYNSIQTHIDEQDKFLENPFEVAEGVLECKARLPSGKQCNSKRVFSYNKMCRSADEPMTTFAQCCACGHKWTYSG